MRSIAVTKRKVRGGVKHEQQRDCLFGKMSINNLFTVTTKITRLNAKIREKFGRHIANLALINHTSTALNVTVGALDNFVAEECIVKRCTTGSPIPNSPTNSNISNA